MTDCEVICVGEGGGERNTNEWCKCRRHKGSQKGRERKREEERDRKRERVRERENTERENTEREKRGVWVEG